MRKTENGDIADRDVVESSESDGDGAEVSLKDDQTCVILNMFSTSQLKSLLNKKIWKYIFFSSFTFQGEEGDCGTSSKFLLLVDQLSVDQKHHLSIKDIGIILDRLSSKIVDVEKLDREKEDSDIYNWTIKATIRGEVMRELGVIYNSNYYSISEHPSYMSELRELSPVGSGSGGDQDATDNVNNI